jgi:hypothetical protein
MQRTVASCYLILAVIACAVLFLPMGNLAPAGMQPAGCPGCQAAGPGYTAGHCCCPAGLPAPCGACGSGGVVTCRCSSGSLAFIFAPAVGTTTWQVSPLVLAIATVPVTFFPPSIFHPPELSCWLS